MMVNDRQSQTDRAELVQANATLAERGIRPGDQGYDLSILAAAVYTYGWTYSIDLASGSYKAIIRAMRVRTQPRALLRQSKRMRYGLVSAYGDTAEEALTLALAQALRSSPAIQC